MAERLNFAGLVVGAPHTGKTTIVRSWLRDFLSEHPHGIGIVHDTQGEFGDLCASYRTVDDFRQASRTAAREAQKRSDVTMQRGIAITMDDSEAVASLAAELGDLHNARRASVRVPIFLGWDETSAVDGASGSYVNRLHMRIWTQRRHLGIATAQNLQSAGMLPRNLWEMSTDVVIFSLTSSERARELEQRLGLERDTLAAMVSAPPHRYVHWQAGKGLV